MRLFNDNDRFIHPGVRTTSDYKGNYLTDIDYRDFIISVEYACLYLNTGRKVGIVGNGSIKQHIKTFFPGLVSDQLEDSSALINLGPYDPNLSVPCLQIVECMNNTIIRESSLLYLPFDEAYKNRFAAFEYSDMPSGVDTKSLIPSLINHDRIVRPYDKYAKKWLSTGSAPLGYDESVESHTAQMYLEKFNISVNPENVKKCIQKFRSITGLVPIVRSFGYIAKKKVFLHPRVTYGTEGITRESVKPVVSQISTSFNVQMDVDAVSEKILNSELPIVTISGLLGTKEPDFKTYGSDIVNYVDIKGLFRGTELLIEGLKGEPAKWKNRITAMYDCRTDEGSPMVHLSIYPEKGSLKSYMDEKLSRMSLGSLLVILTQNSISNLEERIASVLNQTACAGIDTRNPILREPASRKDIEKTISEINLENDNAGFYIWNTSAGRLLGQVIIVISRTLP